MAIIDFFDRGWRRNPQGVAYLQGEQSWTFDQAGAQTCRIANRLLSLGLPRETKGAVWSGNDAQAWFCTLGLWRAGFAWIPVNARNSTQENGDILDTFDCEVLFYQSAHAQEIVRLRQRLSKVQHWVCLDAEQEDAPSLQRWIDGQPETMPQVAYDQGDVVMLSPTGGTTGTPKGVMNTHRSLQTFMAHSLIGMHYPEAVHPVNLAAAPMTHAAGLLSYPCTARGGTVVVLARPDPGELLKAVAQHQVTEFFLPPTVIYKLLEIPGLGRQHFASMRFLMYGAAPMSVDKLKLAIDRFGPIMAGGYGQTEAPASISYLDPQEHLQGGGLAVDERLSSVGRPNPLVRVVIMDDDNRILPAGTTGEICVRGDLVMKGYYRQPEKTSETIVDGWLHTGDVGHLDGDGYLHITDRKRDMIISGGFNVYPSEVEQVIWGHPAVQDCAVIGVPDDKWGEAVKAVVELKPGQVTSAEELIALCKDRLGSVLAPKSVDLVTTLPRSAAGKVLKKDLRAPYWQGRQRNI